jgi:membrane protein
MMQIPGLRGVSPREVVVHAVREFGRDNMGTFAAALAFHTLLALFPFLIFLVALLGFLRVPGFFDWILGQAQLLLPEQSMTQVEQVVGQVQEQARGSLISFGIIGTLWAASTGVRATMAALNAAYDVEETRPAWKRFPLSVIYTVGLAVLLILATGLMLVGPQVMTWLARQVGWGDVVIQLWTWLRLPAAVMLLMVAVAIIYAVAPNTQRRFRLFSPGAVVAVTLWVIASQVFSAYITNFGSYGATYGSLAAVIVLLLYFFLSAAMLLFGAEVNAVIDQRAGAEQSEPERRHAGREQALGRS